MARITENDDPVKPIFTTIRLADSVQGVTTIKTYLLLSVTTIRTDLVQSVTTMRTV